SLQGGQRTPRNAWVNLRDLQDAVLQPKRANVLLVHDRTMDLATANETAIEPHMKQVLPLLNDAVKKVATLDDYGLTIGKSKATGEQFVGGKSTYLPPPIVAAAEQAAKKIGVTPRLVTVNLVNRVIVTDE